MFSEKLWDGSDPTYCPSTIKSRGKVYWRTPKVIADAGYRHDPVRLPGEVGDGQDEARASIARDLTRQAVTWYEKGRHVPKVTPHTWDWLIARYLSDDISPFLDLKSNTQQDYRFSLDRWRQAIGSEKVTACDLASVRRWQKAMKDNGRTKSYIKRMFTALRIVTTYGVSIKAPGARDFRDVLSGVRVPAPKARSASPTASQIMAIIAAADEAGDASFALGLSLQWWLTLRAVDVRGQWLDDTGEGGIRRNGKRWQDGMTWDMISADLTELRKTPSKTERDMPEEMVFDLTPLADLRARLAAIPPDKRVGPVIIDRKGEPYDRYMWTKIFRAHAATAGVPSEVQMRDTRAGAINDALRHGASRVEVQHMANHANAATTDRYIREKGENANNVIRLRTGTEQR